MLEVQFNQEKTGKTGSEGDSEAEFLIFFYYALRKEGIYSNVSVTARGKKIEIPPRRVSR